MSYTEQISAAEEILSMTDDDWGALADAMTVLLVDVSDAPRTRAQQRLSAMATQISRAGVLSMAQRKKEADRITATDAPKRAKKPAPPSDDAPNVKE